MSIFFFFFQVAAAYSYFNLGESSSSSDDEDYSPEDWKKVRGVSHVSVLIKSALLFFHRKCSDNRKKMFLNLPFIKMINEKFFCLHKMRQNGCGILTDNKILDKIFMFPA